MARTRKLNRDQKAMVARIHRGLIHVAEDLTNEITTGQIPSIARDLRDLATKLEAILAVQGTAKAQTILAGETTNVLNPPKDNSTKLVMG